MRPWFASGLLDWAVRCDVSGHPDFASEAVALVGQTVGPPAVPFPAARIHALAAAIEAAGDAALARAVRRLAEDGAD